MSQFFWAKTPQKSKEKQTIVSVILLLGPSLFSIQWCWESKTSTKGNKVYHIQEWEFWESRTKVHHIQRLDSTVHQATTVHIHMGLTDMTHITTRPPGGFCQRQRTSNPWERREKCLFEESKQHWVVKLNWAICFFLIKFRLIITCVLLIC